MAHHHHRGLLILFLKLLLLGNVMASFMVTLWCQPNYTYVYALCYHLPRSFYNALWLRRYVPESVSVPTSEVLYAQQHMRFSILFDIGATLALDALLGLSSIVWVLGLTLSPTSIVLALCVMDGSIPFLPGPHDVWYRPEFIPEEYTFREPVPESVPRTQPPSQPEEEEEGQAGESISSSSSSSFSARNGAVPAVHDPPAWIRVNPMLPGTVPPGTFIVTVAA